MLKLMNRVVRVFLMASVGQAAGWVQSAVLCLHGMAQESKA